MEGLILGSIAYKENSKIIYLLTQEGKDSLLIRGAKKIAKAEVANAQILNLVSYEKRNKEGLNSPSLFEVSNYYNDIKNDPLKFTVASAIIELINNHISVFEDSKNLYNLLIMFLDNLSSRDDCLLLYLQMKFKLLYFLGINPNFRHCIHCGTSSNLVGLSLHTGSIECVNHQSEDNIGMTATKILYLIYTDKKFEVRIEDQETIKYLFNLVQKYYEYHFEITLKSDIMLEKLLSI